MTAVVEVMSWRDEAACAPWRLPSQVSLDDFFAHFSVGRGGVTRKIGEATARAKAVCSGCPVVTSCRREVMAMQKVDRHGVWAGELFTEKQREGEEI